MPHLVKATLSLVHYPTSAFSPSGPPHTEISCSGPSTTIPKGRGSASALECGGYPYLLWETSKEGGLTVHLHELRGNLGKALSSGTKESLRFPFRRYARSLCSYRRFDLPLPVVRNKKENRQGCESDTHWNFRHILWLLLTNLYTLPNTLYLTTPLFFSNQLFTLTN